MNRPPSAGTARGTSAALLAQQDGRTPGGLMDAPRASQPPTSILKRSLLQPQTKSHAPDQAHTAFYPGDAVAHEKQNDETPGQRVRVRFAPHSTPPSYRQEYASDVNDSLDHSSDHISSLPPLPDAQETEVFDDPADVPSLPTGPGASLRAAEVLRAAYSRISDLTRDGVALREAAAGLADAAAGYREQLNEREAELRELRAALEVERAMREQGRGGDNFNESTKGVKGQDFSSADEPEPSSNMRLGDLTHSQLRARVAAAAAREASALSTVAELKGQLQQASLASVQREDERASICKDRDAAVEECQRLKIEVERLTAEKNAETNRYEALASAAEEGKTTAAAAAEASARADAAEARMRDVCEENLALKRGITAMKLQRAAEKQQEKHALQEAALKIDALERDLETFQSSLRDDDPFTLALTYSRESAQLRESLRVAHTRALPAVAARAAVLLAEEFIAQVCTSSASESSTEAAFDDDDVADNETLAALLNKIDAGIAPFKTPTGPATAAAEPSTTAAAAPSASDLAAAATAASLLRAALAKSSERLAGERARRATAEADVGGLRKRVVELQQELANRVDAKAMRSSQLAPESSAPALFAGPIPGSASATDAAAAELAARRAAAAAAEGARAAAAVKAVEAKKEELEAALADAETRLSAAASLCAAHSDALNHARTLASTLSAAADAAEARAAEAEARARRAEAIAAAQAAGWAAEAEELAQERQAVDDLRVVVADLRRRLAEMEQHQ